MAQAAASAVVLHRASAARRYIAELKKLRIRLPSLVGFVGAVGIGLVIGRTMP